MKSQAILVGSAGEHLVMYQLLRLNLIAALAPDGVPNTDILVSDLEGKRAVNVQVKTRRPIGANGGWQMGEKHEKLREKGLYYVFVDIKKDDKSMPDFYIVPSEIVATAIKEMDELFLKTPGQKGQQRKSTSMRWLLPDYSKTLPAPKKYCTGWLDQYKNNWEILGF